MSGFDNDVVFAKNADFSQADNQAVSESNGLFSNGQLWIGSNALNAGSTHINVGRITSPLGTLTIGYTSPNITVDLASGADLHVARYIVASSTANTGANYTTIASAITAAVATGVNSTIFIQPGTYTENLTLPSNINLCAFECDAFTPNVTIVGTITCTDAGSRSMSGIRLQTNSAALLAVTGSAASIVILRDCYLNCTNATGITFSAASTSARIFIDNCKGDIGTTGISLFAMTSTGALDIETTRITNTGASSTASTNSAGTLIYSYCQFAFPTTISSTGTLGCGHCSMDSSATNTTVLTLGGGTQSILFSSLGSGSASAATISTSATFKLCVISSTNTNAITGAGTIAYSGITFTSSSTTINTTTQTNVGTLQGSKNTSPTAGFLGERIAASAQTVAAGNTTIAKTITSINLTPGVWDISTIASGTTGSFNLTLIQVGISTTTNTFEGNTGDQNYITQSAGLIGFLSGDVPAFRVVISATTTYYCVVRLDYAAGSPTVNARISGVRVG